MKLNRPHSVMNVLATTNNYLVVAISIFLLTISFAASVILFQSHKTVCELFNSKMEASGSSIARELTLQETKVAAALFDKVIISLRRVSSEVDLILDTNNMKDGLKGCEPRIFEARIFHPVTFSGDKVGVIYGKVKSFSSFRILIFAVFIIILLLGLLKFIKNRLIENIRTKIVTPIELLCGQEEISHENLPSEVKSIAEKLSKLRESISVSEKAKVELIQAEKISKVATQVAHDIRSPLEMLKGLKSEISSLPESSRRRIQLSINRIEEITFNLLKNHKQNFINNQNIKGEELLSLVEGVMTEKNIEFRNNEKVKIEELFNSNSYGLFSAIERGALKSILSNLINNSLEAFQSNNGIIGLDIKSEDGFNIISVSDNGYGFDSVINSNLFNKGFTTKKTGNGLGLYNAKQDIEAVGGTIVCESEVGKGTTFIISLPKSEAPASFVASIDAYKYERIIVLDDDPAFHEVWSKRLEGLESKVEHIHSVEEMLTKYQALHPKILLLSDFELMDKHLDGIDTILKLNHAEHSILVTARNEEQAIQDRCLKAGIKLLPKSLVNYVMVRMTGTPMSTGREGIGEGLDLIKDLPESSKHIDASKLDPASKVGDGLAVGAAVLPRKSKLDQVEGSQGGAGESYKKYGAEGDSRSDEAQIGSNLIVLIDDDRLVHINWGSHCKKNGLPFQGFKSIDEFLAASATFDKASRIYIDSNLGDGIKGEIESEKIFALGFLNLYLATGYEKDSILKPSWIKEIYSKSPENIG
jgi:signal transduction histidine kinase/CheY-like chemotaxis protein